MCQALMLALDIIYEQNQQKFLYSAYVLVSDHKH